MKRVLITAFFACVWACSVNAGKLDGTWISKTDSNGLAYVVKDDRYSEYFDQVLQDKGKFQLTNDGRLILQSDFGGIQVYAVRFSAKYLHVVDPRKVASVLNFWANPITFWQSHRYNECERYDGPSDYASCVDRINDR